MRQCTLHIRGYTRVSTSDEEHMVGVIIIFLCRSVLHDSIVLYEFCSQLMHQGRWGRNSHRTLIMKQKISTLCPWATVKQKKKCECRKEICLDSEKLLKIICLLYRNFFKLQAKHQLNRRIQINSWNLLMEFSQISDVTYGKSAHTPRILTSKHKCYIR